MKWTNIRNFSIAFKQMTSVTFPNDLDLISLKWPFLTHLDEILDALQKHSIHFRRWKISLIKKLICSNRFWTCWSSLVYCRPSATSIAHRFSHEKPLTVLKRWKDNLKSSCGVSGYASCATGVYSRRFFSIYIMELFWLRKGLVI